MKFNWQGASYVRTACMGGAGWGHERYYMHYVITLVGENNIGVL